jgi:hypothetical protein
MWSNWPSNLVISLTASGTVTTFGLELSPVDGTHTFTVSLYNGQTLLGSITQDASYGQATVFGASSTLGITSV